MKKLSSNVDWIMFRLLIINNTHRSHCVTVTSYITADVLDEVD